MENLVGYRLFFVNNSVGTVYMTIFHFCLVNGSHLLLISILDLVSTGWLGRVGCGCFGFIIHMLIFVGSFSHSFYAYIGSNYQNF